MDKTTVTILESSVYIASTPSPPSLDSINKFILGGKRGQLKSWIATYKDKAKKLNRKLQLELFLPRE